MRNSEFHAMIAGLVGVHNERTLKIDLLESLCKPNNWPVGEIWVPHISGQYMYPKYIWTVDYIRYDTVIKFSSLCKFAKGVGFIGKAWESGQVQIAGDLMNAPDFLRAEVAVQSGIHSVICVPMKSKGGVASVFCFFLHHLKEEDITLAEVLNGNSVILQSIVNSGCRE